MNHILTFESYLKSGRQPLYTWLYDIKRLMKTDVLYTGTPSMDKNFKRRSQNPLKSISLSRSSSFKYNSNRIVLDTDKLIRDGYIPEPFDEFGAAIRKKGSFSSSKSTHFKKVKSIRHGLNQNFDTIVTTGEEEYEERIYKDIKNIGKYIIYININRNELCDDMIKYIKKYPHIEIRELKYINSNHRMGRIKKNKLLMDGSSGELLLDINMIRSKEAKKVALIT